MNFELYFNCNFILIANILIIEISCIGVDIIVSCFSDKDNYFSLTLSDYVEGAVRFHYANQIMPGLDGLALRYSVGLTPTSLLKNLPKTDCETKLRFSLMRSIVWSVTRRRRLLSDRT